MKKERTDKYELMLLTARNSFMVLPEILKEHEKDLKEKLYKDILYEANKTHERGYDFNAGMDFMCELVCKVIEKSTT